MADLGMPSKGEAAGGPDGWTLHEAELRPRKKAKRGRCADVPVTEPLLDEALEHQSAGRLEEAKQCYLRILSVDVKHAWSLYGLGQIAFLRGSAEIAVNMVRRAIAANGREPVYHAGLGSILQSQGKLDEAAGEYQLCLDLAPRDAVVRANLASVLFLLGRTKEAEVEYRKALALDASRPHLHTDLGGVLRSRGALEESAEEYHAALILDPDFAPAHNGLGQTLREQGRLEEAAVEYQRALALNPNSVHAHSNYGNLQLARGLRGEARACYERALSLEPNSKAVLWNRSLIDLLEGNYEQGWRDYDLRCELNFKPPRRFPEQRWRGGPLGGARILLHSEQGLGDTVQFLRYVPLVEAAGGEVALDVPHRVRRLAESVPGVAFLTEDGVGLPEFDYHCPLMSLPLACGTGLDSIPAATPYLRVPASSAAAAARIPWPDSGLRVGLVWSSGPTGPFRSMPLAMLEPLWDVEGIHFCSLQMGEAAAEAARWPRPMTDLQEHMPDLADTGALMQQLDLVITVDTCTAHLAGALGLPAWVMLQFAADWRWMVDREDSPWYPTLRLFRQRRPADWRSVIEQVRRGLTLFRDQRRAE